MSQALASWTCTSHSSCMPWQHRLILVGDLWATRQSASPHLEDVAKGAAPQLPGGPIWLEADVDPAVAPITHLALQQGWDIHVPAVHRACRHRPAQ